MSANWSSPFSNLGYEARSPKESWDCSIFGNRPMPESLHIVKETPQVKGLQTFIRCKDTSRYIKLKLLLIETKKSFLVMNLFFILKD